MNTESTTTIYWPGPPFDVSHHARKITVVNGDNTLPVSLAKRLKQRYSLNGMVGLPVATKNDAGELVEPDSDLVASVKAAADKRNGDAHRIGGQNPIKFKDGKPAPPSQLLVRERPGAKLEAEPTDEQVEEAMTGEVPKLPAAPAEPKAPRTPRAPRVKKDKPAETKTSK